MNRMLVFLVLGFCLLNSSLSAATFTVTSTDNSGAGTLRQAILDANAAPGPNTINFNIPGAGVQTIAPTNGLPTITNQVFIDGFSQPGSSANTSATGDNSVHLIRLDGFKCLDNFPEGLKFTTASPFAASPASGSTVRGLCIVRFYYGISANEISNFTVSGNWLGLDIDGIARGNGNAGIYITTSFNLAANNVIGGTTPASRNVISGNAAGTGFGGINLTGAKLVNALVQGNLIGTDQTGTLPRGNAFGGIYVSGCSNVLIGGAISSARNVVSATTAAGGNGITVSGPNNVIQGNYVGSDVSGQYDLGNLYDGINVNAASGTKILGNLVVNNRNNGINLGPSAINSVVENNLVGTDAATTRPLGNALAGITISGSTNRVGGLSAGQANTIQFNGGAGVEVTSASAVQNEISGNAIYDNGGLGIDLYPVGISTNDVLDADTGANGLQNFPVLTSATAAFSALSVSGTLNSKASATYRLEFFATPTWDATNIAEGKILLGSTNVTTDGSGSATFTAAIATTPDTNYLITATATDGSGNISEFSAGIGLVTVGAASPLLTMSANPSGGGGGSGATTMSVAWPSAATFFSLEKATSLQPPVQWQAVTSGILDAGGVKSVVITNGSRTNEFFRLKKL